MNNHVDNDSALKKIFALINQSTPEEKNKILSLLSEFGHVLNAKLLRILNTVNILHKKNLTKTEKAEAFKTLDQTCYQMLGLTNSLMYPDDSFSENKNLNLLDEKEKTNIKKELVGLNALLVADNLKHLAHIKKELADQGLIVMSVTTDELLQVLHESESLGKPFDIAIIYAQYYGHHVAYLARTIKTNANLRHVMTCLILNASLPDFEIERAHFDGFSCILNIEQEQDLVSHLANSWRAWAAKINFTQSH